MVLQGQDRPGTDEPKNKIPEGSASLKYIVN